MYKMNVDEENFRDDLNCVILWDRSFFDKEACYVP